MLKYTPHPPLLYSKTGAYRGIPIFFGDVALTCTKISFFPKKVAILILKELYVHVYCMGKFS